MAEVKVSKGVVISLSEQEAEKLVALLMLADWDKEPWASDVVDSLEDLEIERGDVGLDYDTLEYETANKKK